MTSRVPVLMYHRIGNHRTEWDTHYSVTPKRFAAQMETLARNGFIACSLTRFSDWMLGKSSMPEKAILITFDDGFCGVHDHALPILRDLAWPFVVFVITGKIGKSADWADPETCTDRSRQLMNRQELQTLLAATASLQSHSASHVDLTTLNDDMLDQEMASSREDLQELTGDAVQAVAYPYGRYDDRVIKSAQKAGYSIGFSVTPGFNRPNAEKMTLRRLDVFGSDTAPRLLRKIIYGSNDGGLSQDFKYLARRLADRLSKRGGVPAP